MNKCAQSTSRISLLSAFLLAATLCPMLAAQTTGKAPASAEVQAKKAWRETMRHAGIPGGGCHQAHYPDTHWEPMDCGRAPASSAAPRPASTLSTTRPAQSPGVVTGGPGLGVGNSNTFVAQAPAGQVIQAALGNFLQSQNLVSENGANVLLSDGVMSNGIVGPDEYTVQLNTNKAYTPACDGFTGCRAYEQFIFSSDLHYAFSQGTPGGVVRQWLLNYSNVAYGYSCPDGYDYIGDDVVGPGYDCVFYNGFILPGTATAADIQDVEVYGITNVIVDDGDGYDPQNGDYIEISFQGNAYIAQGTSIYTSNQIESAWTTAEFNVFGNEEAFGRGGGSQAQFSPGTGFVGLLGLEYNSTDAPTCLAPIANLGPASDSNNLTPLECNSGGGQYPYIVFSESN